jgi:hypothetical protein
MKRVRVYVLLIASIARVVTYPVQVEDVNHTQEG